MTLIKVDPSLLQGSGQGIQGAGQNVSSTGSEILGTAQSAPSYDGQFGPRVAAIGAEFIARAMQLSCSLVGLGERLFAKGVEFDVVDTANITGLENIYPEPSAPSSQSSTTTQQKDKFAEILKKWRNEPFCFVPTQAQGILNHNYGCAPTAISMILMYYHNQNSTNITLTKEQVYELMDPNHAIGISVDNIKGKLDGYTEESRQLGGIDDLRNELKNGPVIADVNVALSGRDLSSRQITGPGESSHSVVVKGITDNSVIINDPWSGGSMSIKYDDFAKMWGSGKWISIIRPDTK